MARHLSKAIFASACLWAAACAPSSPAAPASGAASINTDALVQFSLLAALAADDYDGNTTIRQLLTAGDFGIGTFDRLDGEMIVLHGRVFQALANGTVRPGDLNGTTPFAAVTFFAADGRLERFSAATLDDLDAQLDSKLPRHNSPYALQIVGTFPSLTLRSVPAQSRPYRPLVEVVQQQSTWQHRNVQGTLIGLRCPAWMGTINVSGYHWHFLSNDRQIGGHVLACEFASLAVEYDECESVVVRLPQSANFDQFDERSVSEEDIDRIERQRTPQHR